MLSDLIQALVQSTNEAADEALLEAMRLGSEAEKALALNALLRRHSVRGLSGVIAGFNQLPQPTQMTVLQNIKVFHAALRECSRNADKNLAMTAMKLIALGRQGKLTYVLSEGLHGTDEAVSRSAVEAMVALARWAVTETRKLQTQPNLPAGPQGVADAEARQLLYEHLMEERPEIEQAVARAMDVHRGRHGQDLLRAGLLLADWPGSKTLAILNTAKHGGQSSMVRRLQQAPDSEHVDAFLLGATHGGLRTHFGVVFAHIVEPPVLDALLRRTHWLKDQQLQLCMRQVSRGVWWNEMDLDRELSRRDDEDIARIGHWIAASGIHDVVQDQRLEKLRLQLSGHFSGRLRLLRLAMERPAGASVGLIQSFLNDPDQRIARMAAREIIRRRPADFENMLVHLMASAPDSVRRVVSRSVGRVGFEHFWEHFEHMDKSARKTSGQAMLKVMPDGIQRLERKMRTGPVEQKIKAITIAQELGVADQLPQALMDLCQDPNPRLRSKAVVLLADIKSVSPDMLLEKILTDTDSRVRANAIEVLEARHRLDYVPVLTRLARSASSRERANAIKAMHRMRVSTATSQLTNMLQDSRPEHRISAMWALRQIGWWQMFNEIGRLVKDDPDTRVRRYAMGVLRGVAEMVNQQKRKSAG